MRKRTKQRTIPLEKLYYDIGKVGGYGGVRRLKEAAPKTKLNDVKLWLENEEAYTLHKPVHYNFTRRKVIVGGIDSQWQIDLVDVSLLM